MQTHEYILKATTDTYSSAFYPLGSVALYDDPTNGWQRWLFVKNGGVGAWAQGDIVGRRDGQTTYDCDLCPLNAPSARVAGVAQHAIAASYYGWVLREGVGEVLADTGGYAANQALVVGDAVAGRADQVAAGTTHAFGFSTEAAAATAVGTCWINAQG